MRRSGLEGSFVLQGSFGELNNLTGMSIAQLGLWSIRPARVFFRVVGPFFSGRNRISLWGFYPFRCRRGAPRRPVGARGAHTTVRFCGDHLI